MRKRGGVGGCLGISRRVPGSRRALATCPAAPSRGRRATARAAGKDGGGAGEGCSGGCRRRGSGAGRSPAGGSGTVAGRRPPPGWRRFLPLRWATPGGRRGTGEGGARLREAAALPPAPPRREREEESKQARRTASQFNGLGLRARRVPAWRCSGPREHAGASLARPAAAVAPRPFPSRSEMAGDGEGWGWSCRGSRAPRGWMAGWMDRRARSMRSALPRPLRQPRPLPPPPPPPPPPAAPPQPPAAARREEGEERSGPPPVGTGGARRRRFAPQPEGKSTREVRAVRAVEGNKCNSRRFLAISPSLIAGGDPARTAAALQSGATEGVRRKGRRKGFLPVHPEGSELAARPGQA